jgi:hypothetical protein
MINWQIGPIYAVTSLIRIPGWHHRTVIRGVFADRRIESPAGSRRCANGRSVMKHYDTPVPEAAADTGFRVIPRDVVAVNAWERVSSLTLFR